MNADFKALLDNYKNAVSDYTRMKYVCAFLPEMEKMVGAPLLARQESRMQAAETALNAFFKRLTEVR